MTWVKLCGVTSAEEVSLCARAGADALGFVVEYPAAVPWNLTLSEAQRLMDHVPDGVQRVMVAGDDPSAVRRQLTALRPEAVQLHADEPPEATVGIIEQAHDLGVSVIKALRFTVDDGRVLSVHHSHTDPLAAARRLEELGVDALLLDSVSPTQPAGTGRTVDLTMARRIRDAASVPVILAGGLNPDNVGSAIEQVRPYGVDVISGVERRRRVKDPDKVAAFIGAAHSIPRAP